MPTLMPRRLFVACPIVALFAIANAASAEPIYGGPTFQNPPYTGYIHPDLPIESGSHVGNGVGVGYASRFNGGTSLGTRAFRWDTSGAVELDHLGTSNIGITLSYAYVINTAGTAVGQAYLFDGGASLGNRAVRWDASGTAAVELGHLGTNTAGVTNSTARAINAVGTVVGNAQRYDGNLSRGPRAVRWDASSTSAVELDSISISNSGSTISRASGINTAGTIVGHGEKYTDGSYRGFRAVRWDASGTAATELGHLGTDSGGDTDSYAYTINDAGTAIGFADKYVDNVLLGERAVRWEASSTIATELGHLGTDSAGVTTTKVYAINAAGTAIGKAIKQSSGTSFGERAVRWDASGTQAIELGNLCTDLSGYAMSNANAINTEGTIVGYASAYNDGTLIGNRAVAWLGSGFTLDLNSLLSPADQSLWTLTEARGISDTNWITGIGRFDPDGAGGLAAYDRAFLMQLPEPTSLAALAIGGVMLRRRRA